MQVEFLNNIEVDFFGPQLWLSKSHKTLGLVATYKRVL